jgi:uncharacterized protein YdhG (YjbR/CyaY superfamily)
VGGGAEEEAGEVEVRCRGDEKRRAARGGQPRRLSLRSFLMKKVAAKSVDEYLAAAPEPGRSTLEKVRAVIRSVVPAATSEVISYGIPTFRYKRGLVAFAAFKDHCSFFPLGASVLDEFKEELERFRVSKGTLHFALDEPLPAALVKKIVKARVAQNEGNKGGRSGRRFSGH